MRELNGLMFTWFASLYVHNAEVLKMYLYSWSMIHLCMKMGNKQHLLQAGANLPSESLTFTKCPFVSWLQCTLTILLYTPQNIIGCVEKIFATCSIDVLSSVMMMGRKLNKMEKGLSLRGHLAVTTFFVNRSTEEIDDSQQYLHAKTTRVFLYRVKTKY